MPIGFLHDYETRLLKKIHGLGSINQMDRTCQESEKPCLVQGTRMFDQAGPESN